MFVPWISVTVWRPVGVGARRVETLRTPALSEAHDAWVPAPQTEKRAYFWVHEGTLGLHLRCGSCGRTTHAYPSFFVFVECKCCGEVLLIDWHVGTA